MIKPDIGIKTACKTVCKYLQRLKNANYFTRIRSRSIGQ